MSVVGVGTDLVDLDRFRLAAERTPGILTRYFTEAEQIYADRRQADLARRRAGEALMTAANGKISTYDPWVFCTIARVHSSEGDLTSALAAVDATVVALRNNWIGEIHRVLRPGGRIVISSLCRDADISRLYVVESTYTVTGGTADNRLRLRSSQIPAFAAALSVRLGVEGVQGVGAEFIPHPYVQAMERDLLRAGEGHDMRATCDHVRGDFGRARERRQRA